MAEGGIEGVADSSWPDGDPGGSEGGSSAEEAVRRYLTALTDPERLRDEARIEQLRAELARADDPIDRLRIHGALRRAEQVDLERLEEDFVKHAGVFAAAEGLAAEDFRAVGVAESVLQRAFGVAPGRPRGRSAKRPAGRGEPVSQDRIREGIRSMSGTFVLTEVGEQVGGSPKSIRKAVEDLVRRGEVERLGPSPDHGSRGRAPIRYRRVR